VVSWRRQRFGETTPSSLQRQLLFPIVSQKCMGMMTRISEYRGNKRACLRAYSPTPLDNGAGEEPRVYDQKVLMPRPSEVKEELFDFGLVRHHQFIIMALSLVFSKKEESR
jgi:hypothetical protein